jgi:hypothetical protein
MKRFSITFLTLDRSDVSMRLRRPSVVPDVVMRRLDAFIGRVKSEVDGAVEEHREEAEKLEVTVIENSPSPS